MRSPLLSLPNSMSRTSPYFTKQRKDEDPSSSFPTPQSTFPDDAQHLLSHPFTPSPSTDNASSDIDIDAAMSPYKDEILSMEEGDIEEDELTGVVSVDVEKRKLDDELVRNAYGARLCVVVWGVQVCKTLFVRVEILYTAMGTY